MKNATRQKGFLDAEAVGVLLVFAFILASIAAWFTHIFTCLSEEAWGFLIAGAIMFPIAVIHGFGIWLGLF